MSNYRKYATKANDIAKEHFKTYQAAEREYNLAKEMQRTTPHRHGMVSAEYEARAAVAKANLLTAEQKYKKAKENLANGIYDLIEVRTELDQAINRDYGIDPAQLDNNTLELLKSGILSYNDYERILNDAMASGNVTMIKIICKYAADVANNITDKNGYRDPLAMAYRALSLNADTADGSAYTSGFDVLEDVYRRCTNNPGMINHWDELTADIIKSF